MIFLQIQFSSSHLRSFELAHTLLTVLKLYLLSTFIISVLALAGPQFYTLHFTVLPF
jgi:hypothetical protein